MGKINPTALFLVAFTVSTAMLLGYTWIHGVTVGTGLVLLQTLNPWKNR